MHKYYLFALDKIEAELINHRRNVHIGDPSLPQRAGRAYVKLLRVERSSVGTVTTSTGRVISVRAAFALRQVHEALVTAAH